MQDIEMPWSAWWLDWESGKYRRMAEGMQVIGWDEMPGEVMRQVAERVFVASNRAGEEEMPEGYPEGPWSRMRSMSTGDVVLVGETAFRCLAVGWETGGLELLEDRPRCEVKFWR